MSYNKIIHIKPDEVNDYIWIEIINPKSNNALLQYVFHREEFKAIIEAGVKFLNERGDRL